MGLCISRIQCDSAPGMPLRSLEHLVQVAAHQCVGCLKLSGGEAAVPTGEPRIKINRSLKECLGEFGVVCRKPAQMPQPALVGAPGIEAAGRAANRALPLGIGNRRGDCRGYGLSDLILNREDVCEIAVVSF